MSGHLAEHTRRKFAGHETFPPRFGWLRKAVAAVEADTPTADNVPYPSDVFLRRDATVDLGVGKNMVSAIRYWAQAFKLIEEGAARPGARAQHAAVTAEGRWLLGAQGVDPWLEKAGSLWLLHWWLLRPSSLAPTWWVLFHLHRSPRFSETDLVSLVRAQITATPGWDLVAEASITKDVDCITKMYAPKRASGKATGQIEDLLDCPFRELGLLEAVPGAPKTWRFTQSPRVGVPDDVVAYACLDYLARQPATQQITLSRLAHEPGSVGPAFRLDEPAIAATLERVAQSGHVPLRVSTSLGARSLATDGAPELAADRALAAYFGRGLRSERPAPSNAGAR
jgi:hypothetical protein